MVELRLHDLRCQPSEHISAYTSRPSISMAILIESERPTIPLAQDPADTVPSASKNALQLFDTPTFSLPTINVRLDNNLIFHIRCGEWRANCMDFLKTSMTIHLLFVRDNRAE